MSFTQVAYASAAFTSNGTTDGLIAVSSSTPFVQGAYVWISSTGVAAAQYVIVQISDATHIQVGPVTAYQGNSKSYFTFSDVSAYTTAQSATVIQPAQQTFNNFAVASTASGGGTYTAGTGLTLTGTVFSLTTPVSVANGGTGSTTQNFVDLSTTQSAIAGNKTFTGPVTFTPSATGVTISGAQNSLILASQGPLINITGNTATIAVNNSTSTKALSLFNPGVGNWLTFDNSNNQLVLGNDASSNTTLPYATTFRGGNLIVGGTADQAGVNFTIATGSGKGAGTPPTIVLQAPSPGSSGTTLTTPITAMTVGYNALCGSTTGQTVTFAGYIVGPTFRWLNNGELDLGYGAGLAQIAGISNQTQAITFEDRSIGTAILAIDTTTSNTKVVIGANAASNTTLPVTSLLSGPTLLSGGTADQAGANLTITTGSGKGAGTPPVISLQAPTLGSTGTTLNTPVEVMNIGYNTTQDVLAATLHGRLVMDGTQVGGYAYLQINSTNKNELQFGGSVGNNSNLITFPTNHVAVLTFSDGTNNYLNFNNASSSVHQVEFPVPILATRLISPQTSTYNVVAGSITTTAGDNRTCFTNVGAGSTQITLDLPAATVGLEYIFTVVDSGGVTVVAHGTDVIQSVASATGLALASAAGGACTSTVNGARAHFICNKAGFWNAACNGTVAASAATWAIA